MKYELTPDLLTGNALIDTEHRQLFQAINQLTEDCEKGKGRDSLEKTADFICFIPFLHKRPPRGKDFRAAVFLYFLQHLYGKRIVRRLFCNMYIMRMAFLQSCACNPDKFRFAVQLFNIFTSRIAHTGL